MGLLSLPLLLVTKEKGHRWVPWCHSEPRGSAVGAKRGTFRIPEALQGVRRLAEALGVATFAGLSLLLPPPVPRAKLPAVTRDSSLGWKAVARGGEPREPLARPPLRTRAGLKGKHSPPPPRSHLLRAPAPCRHSRCWRDGGTWARGVLGAPAPSPLPDQPQSAHPAQQPQRAESGLARAPPQASRVGPCARSLPSPPPERAPPLASLPRPTSRARLRGLSPLPPPPPLLSAPCFGLGAGSGSLRDSCAAEHH